MSLLPLTLLFPLIGFVLLALFGRNWPQKDSATLGVGAMGLSALACAYVVSEMDVAQYASTLQPLWTWMNIPLGYDASFSITAALYLDGLSLTMISVVTGVGFLIHLFSAWYMRGEEGYARFFAYTNLFIAFMLVLVLADNLLFLYLGWEGVGLCSYLLIGFYYKDPQNGAAAMKAFIVTRIGDVFMAIGLFILYHTFGTLNIQELNALAQNPVMLAAHSNAIFWAALMLVGGAFGKSAQLPLQTWLADAMAGPTPVSALIHAATMVTAGVYLIARMNGLFLAAPDVLYFVAIIGAVTLVFAGCAALVQTDIKRILAYSTMSQLGYMFLALGVQAWDAAIFHLMTHAFFKALLFLAAGSVIIACHHEQNIFKMGGLWRKLPLTFLSFLFGGGALAALPFITAGFYSKDEILWGAVANNHGGLALVGLMGAFLTALYTYRMIYIVFFGQEKTLAQPVGGFAHSLPLMILIVLSTFLGARIVPPLHGVLPALPTGQSGQGMIAFLSAMVAMAGIIAAIYLYWGERQTLTTISQSKTGQSLLNWWQKGWGFDALYDKIVVRPFLRVAKALRSDPLDVLLNVPALAAVAFHKAFVLSQSGKLRWYSLSVCIGAIVVIAMMLGVGFINSK